MIRFLTAGESHGPELTGIIEGLPAGFNVTKDYIDSFLKRRQKSQGSGGRMNIESDEVEITSGIINNLTTGGPITLKIKIMIRKIGKIKMKFLTLIRKN